MKTHLLFIVFFIFVVLKKAQAQLNVWYDPSQPLPYKIHNNTDTFVWVDRSDKNNNAVFIAVCLDLSQFPLEWAPWKLMSGSALSHNWQWSQLSNDDECVYMMGPTYTQLYNSGVENSDCDAAQVQLTWRPMNYWSLNRITLDNYITDKRFLFTVGFCFVNLS